MSAQSTYDEQQQLIVQIQAGKYAIVLRTLALDDAHVQAFTPVYGRYQVERKKLFDRAAGLLELYGSTYESMPDDVAKVIGVVQIENKLDTLLQMKDVASIPLAG